MKDSVTGQLEFMINIRSAGNRLDPEISIYQLTNPLHGYDPIQRNNWWLKLCQKALVCDYLSQIPDADMTLYRGISI